MFLAGKEFELFDTPGVPSLLKPKDGSLALADFLGEARDEIKALLGQHLALRVSFTELGFWCRIGDDREGPREIQNNVVGATFWHFDPGFSHLLLANRHEGNGRGSTEVLPNKSFKRVFQSSGGQVSDDLAEMLAQLSQAQILEGQMAQKFESALQAEPDLMRVDWSQNPNTLLVLDNQAVVHRGVYLPLTEGKVSKALIKGYWRA